jgi:hypothetical protein
MLDFLKEILTKKEVEELREILEFSLNPKTELDKLQEKIAFANYFHSKLTKIIYKLRLTHTDLEIAFENWYAIEIHNVAMDYDGFPELLKTHKDYEREIKKFPEYVEYKSLLDKVQVSIKSLESKEKELASFDWKVKSIIDIHKIQNNLIY